MQNLEYDVIIHHGKWAEIINCSEPIIRAYVQKEF